MTESTTTALAATEQPYFFLFEGDALHFYFGDHSDWLRGQQKVLALKLTYTRAAPNSSSYGGQFKGWQYFNAGNVAALPVNTFESFPSDYLKAALDAHTDTFYAQVVASELEALALEVKASLKEELETPGNLSPAQRANIANKLVGYMGVIDMGHEQERPTRFVAELKGKWF